MNLDPGLVSPEHPADTMARAAQLLWARAGSSEDEDPPEPGEESPHPGINITVADWLAGTATRARPLLVPASARDGIPAWTCRTCGAVVDGIGITACDCGWHDAIRAARAVLRETGTGS